MQKEKVVKACKSTIGTILIAIFIVIGVFLAVKKMLGDRNRKYIYVSK